MMVTATKPWNVAELLRSPEDVAAYLEAALAENDPAFFRKAIGEVLRASGMSGVAARSGVTREALYKAFGENGNPTLDTLSKVLGALGFRLAVAVADAA